MIGSVNTSNDFQTTTRYVSRDRAQLVYANFGVAATGNANQMAQQMEATAQQSDRIQKPCYHISISPSPEDELSEKDWYDLTEDFLEAMGLADQQAVGWLHDDEEFPDGSPRPHLHLVVNRVGGLGQTYDTSWDYRKVDHVLRGLEASYGLDAVTPANEVDIRRDTPGQVHRIETEQAQFDDPEYPRSEPPEPSKRSQIQSAISHGMEQVSSVESISDFLSRQGINTRITGQGWSFEKDGIAFAGSQLGRRYSMNSVERTMAEDQSPDQGQLPEEQTLDESEQRQRQRSLSMKQLMQNSAGSQEDSHQLKQGGRNLSSTGQHLMREDAEHVDGLTVIGGAIATAGAAVELGEAFSKDPVPAVDAVDSEAKGADVAQSLEHFTQARTQFRGETSPSPYASSAGTVALTREGFQGEDSRLSVTNDDYGTVFEAVKPVDGEWQTQIDELQPEQAETITQLPQSPEEYGQYKRGQQLIGSLQTLPQTADEFAGDQGQINWSSDESGFSYRFDIEQQADGAQRVTGRDANSGEDIFSATVNPDTNGVVVEQNEIPTEQSDELFSRREQELTPPWEAQTEADSQGITLGVQSQPAQRRELEL